MNPRVSAGSWDYRRMEADVTAPLTADGRFRSRVVAAYTDRGLYYDRYDENKMAGMAVLEGDVTLEAGAYLDGLSALSTGQRVPRRRARRSPSSPVCCESSCSNSSR